MNILLISDPELRNAVTWEEWLKSEGHRVAHIQTLPTNWAKGNIPSFDLVIPLITIRDYTDRTTRRYDLVKFLENDNYRLLNSTRTIDLSSDKSLTYKAWSKAGISQPKTFKLSSLSKWPMKNEKMVFKPIFGHSGDHILLVSSLDEAARHSTALGLDAILQEYIKSPKCIRMICSKKVVLSCYEKYIPGRVVANVAKGALRHSFSPGNELVELAFKMMKTIDANLAGLDILISGSNYYALEANIPFGFDKKDNKLRGHLMKVISGYGGMRSAD